jgi:hypothetical protein
MPSLTFLSAHLTRPYGESLAQPLSRTGRQSLVQRKTLNLITVSQVIAAKVSSMVNCWTTIADSSILES